VKLRMRFEKKHLIKFISHLDMLRAFERAMRRAALPVAFTQGFNPRPKISYTAALPLGSTSSGEYMDIEFYEDAEPQEIVLRLNRTLPLGLRVIDVGAVNDKLPLYRLNGATYIVDVSIQNSSPSDLRLILPPFLKQEEIIIHKKTKRGIKEINIAPLIFDMGLIDTEDGQCRLIMDLATGQQGSVSPRELIPELERTLLKEIIIKNIHRENLYLKKDDNQKIFPL